MVSNSAKFSPSENVVTSETVLDYFLHFWCACLKTEAYFKQNLKHHQENCFRYPFLRGQQSPSWSKRSSCHTLPHICSANWWNSAQCSLIWSKEKKEGEKKRASLNKFTCNFLLRIFLIIRINPAMEIHHQHKNRPLYRFSKFAKLIIQIIK